MIGRRALIVAAGSAAVAVAPSAHAQQPARLAWIEPGTAALGAKFGVALRAGLADNGLVEGRDYILDLYYADGDYSRFPALTRQALATSPAILLVITIASVRAAQQATQTTPIVFMSTNDPVGAGLIDSLARPGGNTTGVASMADDAVPKLVEMLRTALPQARSAAVLINPQNPTSRPIFERVRAAAATVGIDARSIEVTSPQDLEEKFGPRAEPGPEAVLVAADAFLNQVAGQIAALGIERRIPILGPSRTFAEAGALLSYGAAYSDLIRRSAFHVKRILAGAKPRDLPVEQPTKFELVLNLKTAKALGIALPPSLLATADETIE
jgi:putative tryptophan/tyrosine transport system substrate-binding protein